MTRSEARLHRGGGCSHPPKARSTLIFAFSARWYTGLDRSQPWMNDAPKSTWTGPDPSMHSQSRELSRKRANARCRTFVPSDSDHVCTRPPTRFRASRTSTHMPLRCMTCADSPVASGPSAGRSRLWTTQPALAHSIATEQREPARLAELSGSVTDLCGCEPRRTRSDNDARILPGRGAA